MKQPPAPGSKSTAKTTASDDPIYQMTFAKGTAEATKNYVKLDPQTKDVAPGKPAILIGNNGQLYLRSDLMPKDGSPVKLTITTA